MWKIGITRQRDGMSTSSQGRNSWVQFFCFWITEIKLLIFDDVIWFQLFVRQKTSYVSFCGQNTIFFCSGKSCNHKGNENFLRLTYIFEIKLWIGIFTVVTVTHSNKLIVLSIIYTYAVYVYQQNQKMMMKKEVEETEKENLSDLLLWRRGVITKGVYQENFRI